MSRCFSLTLGLLFAVSFSGHFVVRMLFLPETGFIAVAVSTAISILLIPFAAWPIRAGTKNLRVYAPLLWVALAIYVVMVVPRSGNHGLFGLLFFADAGLVILRFIPAAN
jgi:hypothetical protein